MTKTRIGLSFRVSIPSGGIILFPPVEQTYQPATLTYRFHPVWRDYPISTLYHHHRYRLTDRFPSRLAGLSYFHSRGQSGRRGLRLLEFPSRLAGLSYFHQKALELRGFSVKFLGFHPVWRDYPISTTDSVASAASRSVGFHPVWRDYPISTNGAPPICASDL